MITIPMMLNDDKELGTVTIWRRDARGNHGREHNKQYVYDAQLIVLSDNGKRIIHDLHAEVRHTYGGGVVHLVAAVFEVFSERLSVTEELSA